MRREPTWRQLLRTFELNSTSASFVGKVGRSGPARAAPGCFRECWRERVAMVQRAPRATLRSRLCPATHPTRADSHGTWQDALPACASLLDQASRARRAPASLCNSREPLIPFAVFRHSLLKVKTLYLVCQKLAKLYHSRSHARFYGSQRSAQARGDL